MSAITPTQRKTHARLSHHESSHITVDTTSGYVVLEGSQTLMATLVKNNALKVGDLVEWDVLCDDGGYGNPYRRIYRRITSIKRVKGGDRIGFTYEDGTPETDDLFDFTKYGWGTQWWLVTEEVSA